MFVKISSLNQFLEKLQKEKCATCIRLTLTQFDSIIFVSRLIHLSDNSLDHDDFLPITINGAIFFLEIAHYFFVGKYKQP